MATVVPLSVSTAICVQRRVCAAYYVHRTRIGCRINEASASLCHGGGTCPAVTSCRDVVDPEAWVLGIRRSCGEKHWAAGETLIDRGMVLPCGSGLGRPSVSRRGYR